MLTRLKICAFILTVMVMSVIPFFTRSADAECQVGAFIADWGKNATFPWNGEQGIVGYESVIQKKVACIKIYKRIVDEFPFAECLSVYNHGTEASPTVPYIDIHPSISDTDTTPILLDIIDGEYDSYIQNWAQEAKEFGKPLWICFDGEMNGNWHGGSGAANGGATTNGYGDPAKADGPEIYIAAWRHIHDIFDAAGASNVAWVWAVYSYSSPQEPWNTITSYYPGDDYVDWLGVDGYNWNRVELGGWQSFQVVFDSALNELRAINSSKPVIIAEFGCAHKRTSKRNWITDAFNQLKTNYPYVKCFIWFDMSKEENWLIDSDGAAAARTALANSYFVSAGDPGTPELNSYKLVNVALNKTVTASSVEAAGLEPSGAVDGVYATRWSSQNSDPQWICVDLGSSYDIARVILNWEAGYGKSYFIQVSADGASWTDIYSMAGGNGNVDNIPLSVTARYVRIYGTERGNTAWGYSLYEFGVYTLNASAGQALHVNSIDMSYKTKGTSTSATAKIKIVDASAQPISGAVVSGHWSGLTRDADAVTTDSNGIAQCNSDQVKGTSGVFTFTVDSVSKDGWTYNSAANAETSDSINPWYSGSYAR